MADGPLESDLLGSHQRLQDCARRDGSHVTPGSPASPFVDAIQEALRQAAGAKIVESGFQGQTLDAVVKFKSDNRLFTRGTQTIDPIVGIGTITALDVLMVKIESKAGRRTQPVAVKTQDIFVRISGFDAPSQQGLELPILKAGGAAFAKKFNDRETYAQKHFPMETIWFVGGESPDPSDEIVKRINALKNSRTLGRVVISGGSAGGRNVLKVAQSLSGVAVTYIAIWDGAFQKENLVDQATFDNPANFNPDNPATLKIKAPANVLALTALKENFFQSFGHCLDRNQEIHGDVVGFVPFDLTKNPNVVAVKNRFDNNLFKTGKDKQKAINDAHTAAFLFGQKKADEKANLIFSVRPLE